MNEISFLNLIKKQYMNPKNHILTLLEHGLSFNTISNLNDLQIKVLSEKFTKKKRE